MSDIRTAIAALHAHFERETQQRLTLSYQRLTAWRELCQRGYTAADVSLVIRWIRTQMSRPGTGYSQSSLQFNRLIQDADLFEDRLNLARKAYCRSPREEHKPAPTGPRGWIAWLRQAYPHARIPEAFDDLPHSIQAEATAALNQPRSQP